MNLKKLFVLFIGLIIPLISHSQYSTFDLSKYRLPDIKINRLDIGIDFYDTGDRRNRIFTNINPDNRGSNLFRGFLDLTYNRFRNTEKFQSNIWIDGTLRPQLNSNKSGDNILNRNYITSSFSLQGTNSFFNKKMNFIEVSPLISFNTSNEMTLFDYRPDLYSKGTNADLRTSISLPVSIGHGRIEPVEDARLAVYIIEELYRINRIAELPDENVILELAGEISKIKRKRIFDGRMKRIKELQVIDSFLVANNIVSTHDIDYFAVLHDQWAYAYGPARETGFAISVGIDNQLEFNTFHEKQIDLNNEPERSNDNGNLNKIGGFLRLRYADPINLYWQNSGKFETGYNLYTFNGSEYIDDPLDKYVNKQITSDISYSIQYIPDSRTSFRLSLSGSYQNRNEKRTIIMIDPTDYKIKSNVFSTTSEFSLIYFISPQFQVQLNALLDFSKTILHEENLETLNKVKEELKLSNHSINLHLTYSFF